MQVNTPFETSPELHTKDAVFDFSSRGGGCGAHPGLQGLEVPCGVRVNPVEFSNASILDWQTACRDFRRVLLRGALSVPTRAVLAVTIFGNAAVEYQKTSERRLCDSSACFLFMHATPSVLQRSARYRYIANHSTSESSAHACRTS